MDVNYEVNIRAPEKKDRGFSKVVLFYSVSTFLPTAVETNLPKPPLLLTNKHPATLQGIGQSARWNCGLAGDISRLWFLRTNLDTNEEG